MNKTKNPKLSKATPIEADLTHCTMPAQYAMRAECQADGFQMRAVMGKWLTLWREDRCHTTGNDGVAHTIPDVDIVFSMSSDSPSLQEVRWLFSQLVDCHVAAQSLSTLDEYTGERTNYQDMPALMQRPSDEVIKDARECARRTKSCLRSDFSRLDDAIALLNAELGFERKHLERRARYLTRLCKAGLGPEEARNDEAKAIEYGRAWANLEWE